MILVIADDFTGASELAGIAIDFGLKTEIQTTLDLQMDVELLVVDTNSRSKTAEEAEVILEKLLESVQGYDFYFIYKKTDSVLRGHIQEELSVLLRFYPGKSIMLSPTNPSRGRTISKGTYFIDGLPIHGTVFSEDPETPIVSSDIYSLVGNHENIQVLNSTSTSAIEKGLIYIGETKNEEEVNYWVNQLDENLIPAGAADFFKAILVSKGFQKTKNHGNRIDYNVRNSLFVCGSSLSRAVNIKQELHSKNPKVVEIQGDQVCSERDGSEVNKISRKIIEHFNTTNNVIITVTTSGEQDKKPANDIPGCLADIVSEILGKIQLDELYIEGGTTSSEIVRKVGWTRFTPVSQLSEGLVRMKVINSPSNFITVKPGSYKWTDELWHQIQS